MNKYIITEKQLKLIKEQVEINDIKLPDFIISSIKQNKTSLGEHPVFPPENEIKFEEKILKKRYYELITAVKKVDGINGDISKKTLLKKLMELVVKCKSFEEPIKKELEQICYDFVNDTFNIKHGNLNIECILTDDIKIIEPITPEPIDNAEFNDVDHIESLNDEILKQRLINSLIQGSCVRLSSNYEKILNKIYVLDQRLPELYYNITAINEYLSFVKEIIPNDDNIAGNVSVDLSGEEPVISAQAIIFPALVFESIKGIMELLSSNSLPDDKKDTEYIINQSDFLLAENWDKRFGVGMWDILSDTTKPENANILPEVYLELISIQPSTFFKVMREVFAGTNKGKQIINNIVEEISKNKSFDEIDDTISDNSEEEFFTPEKLKAGVNGVNETSTTSAGDYTYDAPCFLDAETADHSNMIARSVEDGKK